MTYDRIIVLGALALLLTACGGQGVASPTEPAGTPAAVLPSATLAGSEDAVGTAVAATLTALAPTTAANPVTSPTDATVANNVPTVAPTLPATATMPGPPLPPTATPQPTVAPPTDTPQPSPVPPTDTPAPTEAPRDQTDYSTVPIFNEKNGLDGQLGVAGETALQGPNPIFADDIVIRLYVRDPAAGDADGAGIAAVTFEITAPDGRLVHRRTERTAGYCAFGGGEPTCNRWRFSDHDGRWPELDGQQANVENGSHFVAMTIERTNGETITWNFSFEIQR